MKITKLQITTREQGYDVTYTRGNVNSMAYIPTHMLLKHIGKTEMPDNFTEVILDYLERESNEKAG